MRAAFGDDDSDGDAARWRPSATFTPEQVQQLSMAGLYSILTVALHLTDAGHGTADEHGDLSRTSSCRAPSCTHAPVWNVSRRQFMHLHMIPRLHRVPPQLKEMEELWEEHGSAPNAVEAVRDGLDGDFSRASVARQLQAMGLTRGALTARQARRSSHRAATALKSIIVRVLIVSFTTCDAAVCLSLMPKAL